MENIKYFIDSLNLYSNLLIATLTITIVYFTFRSLRSNQESFRLNMLPTFFPRISTSTKNSILILENHSNYPAYDVDLWIIGHYRQDEIPYKSLLSKKYKDKIKISFSNGLYPYKSMHYSIVDHIIHYAFPPRSKCIIDLEFVTSPEIFDLVLQFRDSAEKNYLYQCWLFTDKPKNMSGNLKLGDFKSSFSPAKRIEYSAIFGSWKDLLNIFKHTNHIFFLIRLFRLIPIIFEFSIAKIRAYLYLKKDVKDALLRSFPSGYQKINNGLFSIEGRGTFTQL